MSIDQHNYELFILDHYEGKLDAAATRELMLYLEQNPEAREAFESYETIMLTPDLNLHFDSKSSLKKTVVVAVGELNEENYEEYFIESIENNLPATGIASVNEFLNKNPHLQKTFDTYKKTVLQPDLSLVFDGKELLKRPVLVPIRSTPVRRLVLVSISVAAALGIVLLSGIMIRSLNHSEKSASSSFSAVDLNKSIRETHAAVNQNEGNVVKPTINNVAYQTNSQLATFDDVNPSSNNRPFDKLQFKKGTHVETTGSNDMAANAIMSKRNEYSALISEHDLLLNRRNKQAETPQYEGLTDYVVSGIKKAARTTAKNQDEIKNNKRLGFWDIAGFGVYAYNKIADKNLVLDKKTDASGRLMSFNLEENNSHTKEKK